VISLNLVLTKVKAEFNLFHSELFSQLDVKDPLIQLANTINWTVLGHTYANTAKTYLVALVKNKWVKTH
jgi:hypothetical protein